MLRALISLIEYMLNQMDRENHFPNLCFCPLGSPTQPRCLYSMSQRNQRKCAPSGICLSSPDLLRLPNVMTLPSILSCHKLRSRPPMCHVSGHHQGQSILSFIYISNELLPLHPYFCGLSPAFCHLSKDSCLLSLLVFLLRLSPINSNC